MKNYNISGDTKITPKRRSTNRKIEPVVTHRKTEKHSIRGFKDTMHTIQTKKDIYSPIAII